MEMYYFHLLTGSVKRMLIAAKPFVQILFTLGKQVKGIIGKRIALFDQNRHC